MDYQFSFDSGRLLLLNKPKQVKLPFSNHSAYHDGDSAVFLCGGKLIATVSGDGNIDYDHCPQCDKPFYTFGELNNKTIDGYPNRQ